MAITLRLGLASATFTRAYPSAQTLDRKSAKTAAHSGTLEKLYPSHDPEATGAGAVVAGSEVVAGTGVDATAVAFGVGRGAVVVATAVVGATVAGALVVGVTVDEIREVDTTAVTVDEEGAPPARGFRFWLPEQLTSTIAVNAHRTTVCLILPPFRDLTNAIHLAKAKRGRARSGAATTGA